MNRSLILVTMLLAACAGEGTWTLETWGEEYIEVGIPASAFEDGCSVVYDRFLVLTSDRVLLNDEGGDEVAALDGAQVYDQTVAGPTEMATVPAKAGTWHSFQVTIAPDPSATAGSASEADTAELLTRGASVLASGTLTCPDRDPKTFDWALTSTTTYECDPENLVIPNGGEGRTQLTIHGDHLWYDSLYAETAVVRGLAIADADADEDGAVTEAELAAAPVAPTGYTVGTYTDVTDLWAYLQASSRSLGHVDGEGHCGVR